MSIHSFLPPAQVKAIVSGDNQCLLFFFFFRGVGAQPASPFLQRYRTSNPSNRQAGHTGVAACRYCAGAKIDVFSFWFKLI